MLITLLSCLVLIGLDQFFKWLAVQYLAPIGAADIIPGVVGLQYVENTGAAFGMLAGRQVFLILVTGIALAVILYILLRRRPQNRLEYIAFIMIFAGGVGNLIDRVANGFVVDYINLLFMNFAVFNFADCLVCVGFGLLVIAFIRSELQARKAKQAGPREAKTETGEKAGETVGDDGVH